MNTQQNESTGGELSSLDRAGVWLNSSPLTAAELRGRVVVIDFWTYTCINWLRTLPYVRAWHHKYREQGLVVVGVHTPEFSFEHDLDNVRRATTDMAVDYPVVIDNDYDIWQAFSNHYWPALYFVDARGRVRDHSFGEGDYERSERIIQELLAQAGADRVAQDLITVDARGAEAGADWDDLRTPETYVGFERGERLASPGGVLLDRSRLYASPARLRLNDWALSGDWTVQGEGALLNQPGGGITYRFHGRDLHLVMGPAVKGATVPFRVLVDGQPPGHAHGLDVDEHGIGTVTEQRLYQLIRQPGRISERTFEITFAAGGVEAYVFTFG